MPPHSRSITCLLISYNWRISASIDRMRWGSSCSWSGKETRCRFAERQNQHLPLRAAKIGYKRKTTGLQSHSGPEGTAYQSEAFNWPPPKVLDQRPWAVRPWAAAMYSYTPPCPQFDRCPVTDSQWLRAHLPARASQRLTKNGNLPPKWWGMIDKMRRFGFDSRR
eukprot:COSAG01_NODE_1311_length_10774_cov_18.218299_15_plen_165_part_00